jgi:hypothetical protein
VVLAADPAAPLQAATKQYVDTLPRSTIYAAPFDAMAYNGMQINGSMEVNQEGTPATASGTYCCDGWQVSFSGVPGTTSVQDTAVPYGGFIGRLYLWTTTAKPTLAAGDYLMSVHLIEGYRMSRLGWGTANAQPITIGFWAQNSIAGLYSVAVKNSGANRTYMATYTQNVAQAMEYKTITIPGDTTGTWGTGNGRGMDITFAGGSGTTLTAPSTNTWLAGNYVAAAGQVNIATAANSYVILRGVVVLPGIEAPSAARSALIMRPYDQELMTCKRYWHSSYPLGTVKGTASVSSYISMMVASPSQLFGNVAFPVTMRSSPTLNTWAYGGNGSIWSSIAGADFSIGGVIGSQHGLFGGNYSNPTAVGTVLITHYTADARL